MNAMIKKEFLEIVRTKKLIILIIIFLFVAVASPIVAKLIPTLFKNLSVQGISINIPMPTWRDAVDQFVKNLSQLALIVIVFMFAGSIAEEKNKKTLEIVLTKPVARSSFIFSKFAAALTVTSVVYIAGSIIFYAYTVSVFGGFSASNFALLALFLLVYLWQVISLTLFCSTLFNNQILAAGVAFFIEIVVVNIIGSIDKIAKYLPGYVLGHYPSLLKGEDINTFWPSLAVSIILVAFLLISSIIVFRHQEIER